MLGMIVFATTLHLCSFDTGGCSIYDEDECWYRFGFFNGGTGNECASLSVLAKIFVERSILLYVIVILICSLYFGLFFDWLVANYKLPMNVVTNHHHENSGVVSQFCAVVLLASITYHTLKLRNR